MAEPAAKHGDTIVATDTHIVMIPGLAGEAPTPVPHPFNGIIRDDLSQNVRMMGAPAAIVGSVAHNTPPHTPQGGRFQRQPSNKGKITTGSRTVLINGKPAARNGDTAITCNDPMDQPVGKVVAKGTILIGS